MTLASRASITSLTRAIVIWPNNSTQVVGATLYRLMDHRSYPSIVRCLAVVSLKSKHIVPSYRASDSHLIPTKSLHEK